MYWWGGFVVVLSAAASLLAAQVEADSALTRLEQRPASKLEVQNALGVLRAEPGSVRDAVAQRLLEVVQDEHQHLYTRAEVLRFVLERPDSGVLQDVVSAAGPWAVAAAEGDRDRAVLLAILYARLPGLAASGAVPNNPEFVEFLRTAIGSHWSRVPGLPDEALLTILPTVPLSPRERSELALQVILEYPQSESLGAPYVFGLAAEQREEARDALSQSATTPEGFQYAAASALATLGDRQVAATLRDRALQIETRLNETGFRQLHSRLQTLAMFADAAGSPETLVAFIGDQVHPRDHGAIRAALRTAAAIGCPNDAVRHAILNLAARTREYSKTLTGDTSRQEAYTRTFLAPVRAEALELGFIEPADLPQLSERTDGSGERVP
jgi:hypothetical protein